MINRITLSVAAMCFALTGCLKLNDSEKKPAPSEDISATAPPIEEAAPPAPLSEVMPTTLEDWFTFGTVTVVDNAAESPAEKMDADKVTFEDDALIYVAQSGEVLAGDKFTFDVWLWADTASQAVIYVNEGCGEPQGDVSFTFVELSTEPQRFSHTHTFANAQECAQMQIKGNNPPMSLYAYGPTLTKN